MILYMQNYIIYYIILKALHCQVSEEVLNNMVSTIVTWYSVDKVTSSRSLAPLAWWELDYAWNRPSPNPKHW